MITEKIDQIQEPSDARYTCANTGGVETETGEFLYGLVRMIKPEAVLETGTHWGIAASYIGDALKKNGFGKLITIEYEQQNLSKAKELFTRLDLNNQIQTELVSSLEYQPTQQFDLIWLDTEPNIRFQELIKYFPFLKQGGYIFIHDLHRHMSQTGLEMNGVHNWPFGDLPKQINDWIKDGELVKWSFGTPRGLIGFFKPTLEDYKAI